MIDFVNNDEECRSVQLLRYFNEKAKGACGRCDVCMTKRTHRVPYQSIDEKLETILHEEPQPMSEVLQQCQEYDEAQVLDAIRFMIDEGKLQMDGQDTVKRTRNKKSRQG